MPGLGDTNTIEALAARAQAGDRGAFGQLVRLYEDRVFGLVSRMVTNPAIAAEISQDTFLRAFQAIATFDRGSPFEPWLLRIARNRVYDHLRRIRVRPVSNDVEDAECPAPRQFDPEVAILQRELGSRIENAIGQMKVNYRESLVLRLIRGFSFDEMGAITGQSADAAKARFIRARLQLREILASERDSP